MLGLGFRFSWENSCKLYHFSDHNFSILPAIQVIQWMHWHKWQTTFESFVDEKNHSASSSTENLIFGHYFVVKHFLHNSEVENNDMWLRKNQSLVSTDQNLSSVNKQISTSWKLHIIHNYTHRANVSKTIQSKYLSSKNINLRSPDLIFCNIEDFVSCTIQLPFQHCFVH